MSTKEFTIELMQLLESVKKRHGDNTTVLIRTDCYGVIVQDVVTNKILYDADTLAEFTYKFHPTESDKASEE